MKLSGRCKNRILSLILTVLMVFSAISTVVFSFCVSETYAASDETVYLTGTPGEKRIQFVFKYGDAALATKIVHKGDTIKPPDDPSPLDSGTVFDHWATGTGNTTDITSYFGRALSASDITALAAIGTAGADNLYSIDANAVFSTAHKAVLHQFEYSDEDNRGVIADVMHSKTISGEEKVNLSETVFRVISAENDINLTGWEIRDSGGDITASFDTDDMVTLSSDTELYPVLSSGSWVTFDTLGASLLPSAFIVFGGTLSYSDIVIPEGSFYPGYEFDGWYRSYDDSDELPEGESDDGIYAAWRYSGLIEEDEDIDNITSDITIYAKWKPTTAKYTVIHMIEGANGLPGQGNYTQYSVESLTGTTGDVIPVTNVSALTSGGYHLPGSDENYTGSGYSVNAYEENQKEVLISGDGKAVKYVYHNRDRYRVTFSGVLTTGLVKWGEPKALWDTDGKAQAKCVYSNTQNIRWEVNSGTSFYSKGDASFSRISNMGDKASVTAYLVTYNFKHKVIEYYYYECIPGVSYTGKTTKNVTLNGVTKSFYLNNVSIWNSANKTATNSNYTRGYQNIANGCLTGWAYRDGSGVHAAATTSTAVTCTGYNSTYNGTTYKCSYDNYIKRGSRTLSFANYDGVDSSADLSSKSVLYQKPLTDYDPHFVVGETTRSNAGKTETFAGWFKSAAAADDPTDPASESSAVDFSSATMPSGNITYYAGWVPVEYEITFDANGGTFPAASGEEASSTLTKTVTDGNTVTLVSAPERTGYTLVGWFSDANLTKLWNFYTDTVHENMILYAKWERGGEYTASYYDAGGIEITDFDKNTYYDGARVLVKEAYRSSYDDEPFLGWSRSYDSEAGMGDSSDIVRDFFLITDDISLYAVYGPSVHEKPGPTVTLHTQSVSAPSAISADITEVLSTVRKNDATLLPGSVPDFTSPARYIQIGWNTRQDGSGTHFEEDDVIGVEADSDLYAEWMRMPDLVLRKNVTGSLGDRTKLIEATITLTGLTPSTAYTTTVATMDTHDTSTVVIESASVGTLNQEKTEVTSDASGTITMLVKMHGDDVFVLNSLDIGATYSINEAASDHVSRYRVTAEGPLSTDANFGTDTPVIAGASGTNGNISDRALSTQTETVDRGDGTVTVLFTNNRDIAVITGVPHLDEILYGTVLLLMAAEYFVIRAILRRRNKDTDDE